ncbi:MAG TPA: hypothetical protein VF316_07390, partial [Polyangiaceae bacterium]
FVALGAGWVAPRAGIDGWNDGGLNADALAAYKLEQDDDEALDGVAALAASAASGRTPPAGPEFRRGALARTGAPLSFDKPLCVALDGFSLHAATSGGALDAHARESRLKYVVRQPQRGFDRLIARSVRTQAERGRCAHRTAATTLLPLVHGSPSRDRGGETAGTRAKRLDARATQLHRRSRKARPGFSLRWHGPRAHHEGDRRS